MLLLGRVVWRRWPLNFPADIFCVEYNVMSSFKYGALVALAIVLVIFSGPINALVVVAALWGIMYLIESFPGGSKVAYA